MSADILCFSEEIQAKRTKEVRDTGSLSRFKGVEAKGTHRESGAEKVHQQAQPVPLMSSIFLSFAA